MCSSAPRIVIIRIAGSCMLSLRHNNKTASDRDVSALIWDGGSRRNPPICEHQRRASCSSRSPKQFYCFLQF